MELSTLTIRQIADGLRKKKFSAEDLAKATLDRAKKANPALNAYVTITEKEALAAARGIDARLAKGEKLGLLAGVPASIKDLLMTKGVRTTCCSRILKDFVPPYDATVIEKLKAEGMVLIGKTNLDEFACGASTEHSCFGVTKNPWDLSKVAGGSSGGSAAAVAAGLSTYALGTDTGGSIRQPASLCGVVGLKVTYGRVSRFGVNALASSWDTVGHFSRTVSDAALVLQVTAGRDPRDATTPDVSVPDYTAGLGKPVKGLKIGIPKEYFEEGLEPEVDQIVRAGIAELKKQGAKIVDVSLPYTKYAIATYYVSMPAELSANLARFDGIRYGPQAIPQPDNLYDFYCQTRAQGFGDEIKRRIMIGTYVLSSGYYDAYYLKAQKVRTRIIDDFAAAFKKVDVMIAPTSPFPAFAIGEKANDPLAMYLADAMTIPANAAGIPSVNLPCGFTKTGLPVGMQVMGPQFAEALILQVAHAYEQATEWHTKMSVVTC